MRADLLEAPKKKERIKKIFVEKLPEEQKYTALCTNCDERFDCKIRNNASVIWHCEEYK